MPLEICYNYLIQSRGTYSFDSSELQMEGERIGAQYNYDATTSPDDPAPCVDRSSRFFLPPGWGMQSTTHLENLTVWTQP